MFLASNCTCAVYFTYIAHVQLLATNMAATHVHAFAYAFAYAIKQTPYAFVSKIILCMYLLYGKTERYVLSLLCNDAIHGFGVKTNRGGGGVLIGFSYSEIRFLDKKYSKMPKTKGCFSPEYSFF